MLWSAPNGSFKYRPSKSFHSLQMSWYYCGGRDIKVKNEVHFFQLFPEQLVFLLEHLLAEDPEPQITAKP